MEVAYLESCFGATADKRAECHFKLLVVNWHDLWELVLQAKLGLNLPHQLEAPHRCPRRGSREFHCDLSPSENSCYYVQLNNNYILLKYYFSMWHCTGCMIHLNLPHSLAQSFEICWCGGNFYLPHSLAQYILQYFETCWCGGNF